MGTLHGVILDGTSKEKIEAKVHVLTSAGQFRSPAGTLLKVGPGRPFFYCEGEFTVDVPRGKVDILVERGTEYVPLRKVLDMPKKGAVDVELILERWTNLPEQTWYPGNTHIHYDEKEAQPDDRLRLDPLVHDFSVTVVSILKRWDLAYASNKYAPGLFTDLCTAHHVVDIGEENRHNAGGWGSGYGHIMFLRIRNVVEPISRGALVDKLDPDYPPLCFACDDARSQDGIVLWCHNGNGMEAPVAAALGKVDAFNLFDPYWSDLEYDIWYKMLNCGIRLPASTGSDWFVCSNNRVYVQTDEAFEYDTWIEGLQRGRTFITNGPALFLHANGLGPGDELENPGTIDVEITWQSHYPVGRVELVRNGAVAATRDVPTGDLSGEWRTSVPMETDGWIAARCSGGTRDSFDQAVYAHTSPVYVRTGRPPEVRTEDAAFFTRSIDNALDWVTARAKFTTDGQREEVQELFRRGRSFYEKMTW